MNMLNRNILLTILILTPLVLSISLSMDIYVPSLPMIINKFHTSQQALQWTLSIYMFGVGIGQLCFGPLSDYLGRRKIVLSGLCLYLLGTLVCIFAPSITLLIVGRLLQSIGTCAALVVAYAVVRDVYDTKTSAKIYSFLNAATAVGPVIAPLLGGYLQTVFGTWRASFVLLFIFAGLSLFTSFYFLSETLPLAKRAPLNFAELRRRYHKIFSLRSFTANAYHSSVGMTILFIFCCISSYLLIDDLQVSQMDYGFAFASNAIVFIIANLISTQLSQKFELKLPIKFGISTIFLGAWIMVLINTLGGLSTFHFMSSMWIMTFGAGLMMGPSVAIALEQFPEVAGTASSIINASQFIIAGVLGTILMMHPVTGVLPFALLMAALSAISLWIVAKKPPLPSY